MKKRNLEIKVRKHFLILLFAVLDIAGAVFQGIYDWYLHKQNNSQLAGQALISSLINKSVSNLDAPASVDAKTGQVYFPDAKLVLPAPTQNLSLRRVEYINMTNGKNFNLQITTHNIVSNSEAKLLDAQSLAQSKNETRGKMLAAIFRQVPGLQACARGVQLFYRSQTGNGSGLKLQFTKKLNNGNTLYAYSEPACQAYSMPSLVKYLKQIQSY